MNFIKVKILVHVLIWISTATEIFYVLPDNSPNISCPSHQCATFSQYFLDNDTLPVVSNVEYHLLPGEHHVFSTERIVLAYLQNFSLVGLYNKQQELPSTILVSTNITILNSYNFTITNVIFKTLVHFSDDINVRMDLIVCIYCTIENVTLLRYGLLGYNLIGRSYLNNIIIRNTEYWCNDYQGIMLHYGNYSFNESKSETAHGKSITTIQNISYNFNSVGCTNRGIIYVYVEAYQIVDSIEIIISNSQFNNVIMSQPIIRIKDDHSETISCMICIINCTFESISVSDTPMITITLPKFNTALIFVNCGFHYCDGSEEYLVEIIVTLDMNFRNVICTDIAFNKCNFSNNNGGLLTFRNVLHSYCNLNILFEGPTYISDNRISSASANVLNLIYIDNMTVYIYGPINISNNIVHNDIMVFHSCKVFINGPVTISSNVAFEKNIMLLQFCYVFFQGPITISHHYNTDSIILCSPCRITFDKQIMFISNICDEIINIKLQHTYIKVLQNANITFLTNECSALMIL